MRAEAQPTRHEELNLFDLRVIVAGSRRYRDYRFFTETMEDWERRHGAGKKIVYLSGMATSGADEMVVRWCKETGRAWAEFPALWEDLSAPDAVVKDRNNYDGTTTPYNALAGFTRNVVMSAYATDMVGFHDGLTPGTGHMRNTMLKKVGKDHVWTIIIELPPRRDIHWQIHPKALGRNPLNDDQRK
jgi:hypothetical protein